MAFSFLTLQAIAAPGHAAEYSTVERLWYAQGHTHPIVVHFPIALLFAAAVASALRVVFKRISLNTIYFCLLLGAGGAVVSCLAGWAWAPQEKPSYVDALDANSPIFWHRWGGIGITLASVGVLVWATLQMRKPTRRQWPWQLATVLIAGATGWVGHEGGELVYPDNMARILAIASGERAPELKGLARHKVELVVKTNIVPLTTQPGHPTTNATTAPTLISTGTTIDFNRQIRPIFEEKCIYCHGPDKEKGDFRMDSEDRALKGGTSLMPLYVKGKSAESAIIKHITGVDDEDFPIMPPKKEKKAVTDEELKTIRQWIDDGAVWNR